MSERIDIDYFLKEFDKLGINSMEFLTSKSGLSEEDVRACLKLLLNPKLLKEKMGVDYFDLLLMSYGLTREEAKYVSEHPCVRELESECDYFREKSNCGACTYKNGLFLLKTKDGGKIRPNFGYLAKLPKDTLYIKPCDIPNLDSKLKDFLSEE